MRQYKTFDIAFVGLKQGLHQFDYQLNDSFFESFSSQEFKESKLTCHLEMDKKENFFLLNFDITGSIQIPCDRCGDVFEMEIWDEFPLIVKRTTDPDASLEANKDPNITFIAQHKTVMNIAKWCYDFALLSIPMQRIHPKDENNQSTCNPEVLKKLESLKQEETDNKNPIWKGLEKFRSK